MILSHSGSCILDVCSDVCNALADLQLVFRDLGGQLHKILPSWLRPYSTWLCICSAVAVVGLVSWLTVCTSWLSTRCLVAQVCLLSWLHHYTSWLSMCSTPDTSCPAQFACCFVVGWLSTRHSVAQVACLVGCITFTKLAIHMLYTCASCSTQLVLLSCICYTLLLVGCPPLYCVQLGTLVCTILAPMLANFPI